MKMTDKMIRFGTGGWRAQIGDDFIKENVCKIAQGVAQLAQEEKHTDKPIMIGYDRRFLSDTAAKWVAEVLAANGLDVLFLHRSAPTPYVMYTVKTQRLYYGIEITASHNPAQYNGIKLITEEGRDASVACTEHLERIVNVVQTWRQTDFSQGVASGKIRYIENPFNDYIDSILSRLDVAAIRKKGLRILFDPMHGSGIHSLLTVLYTARCTVDVIHSRKDAYFGGKMPAPGQAQLRELSELVVEGHYDLGIALDGDGDRLGIIDSNGNYVDANRILVMLYYYLHEYRGWKGPVVRNSATTHMLDAVAESLGERCYEVPVGFKWISQKLDETDAVLGGESSGGLTVRGHIFGKDSTYAAALFVEMLSALDTPQEEFWDALEQKYGTFRMVESNLVFTEEKKAEIERILLQEKRLPDFGKTIEKVSYADGCKVFFESGAFLSCRFSGTEPLLRIFAEDKSYEQANKNIAIMKRFLAV